MPIVLDRETTDLLGDSQWSKFILGEKPSSQFTLPKYIRTTGDADWHCWDISEGGGGGATNHPASCVAVLAAAPSEV